MERSKNRMYGKGNIKFKIALMVASEICVVFSVVRFVLMTLSDITGVRWMTETVRLRPIKFMIPTCVGNVAL
jgi:hypothetical protein